MADHALACTSCNEPIAPPAVYQLPPQVEALHEQAIADNAETSGLWGQFQPAALTGNQRQLFDCGPLGTQAHWPESKPASAVSLTWPRPWSKSTPADAKIARKFKAEDTPADLF